MADSSASILIRSADFPAEYPEIYRLWQNAGSGIQLRRSDEPAEMAKKVQRDPDLFLVAVQQGKIVGAVLGGYDGRRGLVYHLAVDPAVRRQGIGRRLMAELERRLRAKGCIRYYLLVTPDNLPAMRFYESLGWGRMPMHIYARDIPDTGQEQTE